MSKVLVSGANGFIGKALSRYLIDQSYEVRGLVRTLGKCKLGIDYVSLDLERSDDLSAACCGVDCIVHLAGRAHVLNECDANPLQSFREANCEASLRLARQAVASDTRRFIYISSIGVNGVETSIKPFDEQCKSNPHSDYAVSKSEAEIKLNRLLTNTKTELVIIRPPLVYGVNAPGNFARLIKLVASGVPLPLGRINNRRSIVSLDNLVSFIAQCVEHPAAAGQLFLLSDGQDVSTTEIVQALARGVNSKALMLPVPDVLLKFSAKLLKKENLYIQLYRSLQIDSSKARKLLGWQPNQKTIEVLEEVGRLYASQR
ncbi:NAD-dependent epimerase/dehydratase family protein [uncultured Microbulbifer sp.]|uniref:NAD-dependent epimerase/dehydratase family protein n=1 Tax=uncultured Microbulbifer sp. TaxID=348147 RepID=UPI0026018B86|nr:NAD-dependent epimerase/dehydratase family protein [uncultured Microbulbifer sp.]